MTWHYHAYMTIRLYASRAVEARQARDPRDLSPMPEPEPPASPFADSAATVQASPRGDIFPGTGMADSPPRPYYRAPEQSTLQEVPKGYEVQGTAQFELKGGK